MIELTQQQWQAIIKEKNPTVIEPESKKAYVVIPKEEYEEFRALTSTDAETACVLRIIWMRRMGLDENEIAESIQEDPPVNVQEEMKQLKALANLEKITPPAEVFHKHAKQY